MKNEFLHKLFGTLLWVAVGFIICLIFWRPWEQVIITSGPTAAEIVKHTVEPAKVIDTAIKQKAKEEWLEYNDKYKTYNISYHLSKILF